MKGQCGKKSFFGGQLPCPDNSLAEEPEEEVRKKLVDVCGDDWKTDAICCDNDQVSHGIEACTSSNTDPKLD